MNRLVRLGLLACATLAAIVASVFTIGAAQAACDWNINGKWNFYQDNGITVTLVIQQAEGRLTGDASFGTPSTNNVHGTIDGTIDGSYFSFTASWGGAYDGQIGDQGQLSGNTSGVDWHEYNGKRASCIAGAPPAESPTAFCRSYADDAVAQAAKNLQMNCGFTGPRWSTDRDGHLNWCMSLNGDAAPAATEGSYRIVGLKDCAAKAAATPPVITFKRKLKIPTGLAGTALINVLLPVDVYAAAGGEGTPIGALVAGEKVVLVGCADPWCHISEADPSHVPGGDGWVYDAPDYHSLDR